jgi:hypothetical protein
MRAYAILVLCVLTVAAFAQVTTPKMGSADRTAMMNALRVPIEKAVKQKVQFKVNYLKMSNGWAFMKGIPQQKGGKPINYRKTPFQEDIDAGAFDDWVCALFHKKNGKWVLVTHVLGATDVPYVTWPDDYHAPRGIFDMPRG